MFNCRFLSPRGARFVALISLVLSLSLLGSVSFGQSLRTFAVSSTSAAGGNTVTATVTLTATVVQTAGFKVNLASSSSFAPVQNSVTIPKGSYSATVKVVTVPVAASATATLSATLGSKTLLATLKVLAPSVASVTVSPDPAVGGTKPVGEVSISSAAPAGGLKLTLSSSNKDVTVPSSVTVAAGKTSATFSVTTTAVSSTVNSTVAAGFAGATRTTALSITPNGIASLNLSTSSLLASRMARGTVMLKAPAPAGGYRVAISTNSPHLTLPASVSIAAGATSASFTIWAKSTAGITPAQLSAQIAGAPAAVAKMSIWPSGMPAAPWPAEFADNLNSMRGVGSGAVGKIKWSLDLGLDSTISNPLVGGDGDVYFSALTTLYAVNGQTGKTRWTFTVPGYCFGSFLLASDGNLLASSLNGTIYDLDVTSGAVNWSFNFSPDDTGYMNLGPDGSIYVSTDNGLMKLTTSGTLVWTSTLPIYWPRSGLAIGPDGSIYLSGVQTLSSINPITGAPNWQLPCPELMQNVASIGPNNQVLVSGAAEFNGYDTYLSVNGATGVPNFQNNGTLINPAGQAVSGQGVVYAFGSGASYVTTLFAIDATSGATLWSTPFTNESSDLGWSVPSIGADGTIYVAGNSLYAINPTTGAIEWSTHLGGSDAFATSNIAIGADGTLYVMGVDQMDGGGHVHFYAVG